MPMPTPPTQFPPDLIASLRRAASVVALTGAGISAESGVPTFRDAQSGLWAQYSPADLATPEAFQSHPRRVWEWYEWRRNLVKQAQPNPGHHALRTLLKRYSNPTLITQNVDALHHRAGSESVLELHGNLFRTICSRERHPVTEWSESPVPPPCPQCGSPLRPDVVWFGESLPETTLTQAFEATRNAEVFLSIGTSTTVYPAAELPFEAQRNGAQVIEINPETTPFTARADWTLQTAAGTALPQIVALLDSN